MQRAAASIDIAAIGRNAHGNNVGAKRAKKFRAQFVSRAIGAVQNNPKARKPRARKHADWRCAGRTRGCPCRSGHGLCRVRDSDTRPKSGLWQREWRRPAAACRGRRECHRFRRVLWPWRRAGLPPVRVEGGRFSWTTRKKLNTRELRDFPVQRQNVLCSNESGEKAPERILRSPAAKQKCTSSSTVCEDVLTC